MGWQQVATLAELAEGAAMEVHVDGEPVCLVRTADGVKAIHNVCSHQQWSLHDGWIDDNTIECSLHGSSFDLDTGQPRSLPAVRPVPVYACKTDGEAVLVDLARQLNDAPVPRH